MCGGGLPVGKRLVGDTVVECAPREAGESTRASGADVAEARQHPDRQYHANAGALQHAMDAITAQNRATDLAHAHTTRSLKERSASSASASSEAEGEIASSKSPPVAITGASQREKGARQKGAYEVRCVQTRVHFARTRASSPVIADWRSVVRLTCRTLPK